MPKKKNSGRGRHRLFPVSELIREAIRHEANTAEGVLNMVTLGLIVVALIAGPIISGAVMEIEGDSEGWTFQLHMGDVTGGLGWLVIVAGVCLAFVGGTNYFRDRGHQ